MTSTYGYLDVVNGLLEYSGVPAIFLFSGWKNSFYGDLHANSKQEKMLTVRW